jgi:CheY-like chemotaxis protein
MVYIVDDDLDDRELVEDALHEHCYNGPVCSLSNGRLLIDQLNTSDNIVPSVIILDLNMPLFDGFQTLEAVKNNPAYKNTPIIILTASSRKEDEIKCFALGCDFYLNKPTKVSEYQILASLVKRYAIA